MQTRFSRSLMSTGSKNSLNFNEKPRKVSLLLPTDAEWKLLNFLSSSATTMLMKRATLVAARAWLQACVNLIGQRGCNVKRAPNMQMRRQLSSHLHRLDSPPPSLCCLGKRSRERMLVQAWTHWYVHNDTPHHCTIKQVG